LLEEVLAQCYWSPGVPDVEAGLWKAFNDPFMYNNNIAENPARDRACPDFPLLHWKAYVSSEISPVTHELSSESTAYQAVT
jgi:hypothetical protein